MSVAFRGVLALACVLAGHGPAMAQSVDCDPVGRTIVFCYPPGTWRAMDDNQPETIGSYAGMNDVYAQFFVDAGGRAAGQSLEDVQAALLAGMTGGRAGTEIPVIETAETDFWGDPARTLVLAPIVGEAPAMVTATLVVRENETMRLVTATQAESYSSALRQMHQVFLDEIRIVNPDG